jgi:hypothetical protein
MNSEQKNDNVDRLVAAGCCNEGDLTDRDRERLASLSGEEVATLIDLHDRLGPAESDTARPAFPL